MIQRRQRDQRHKEKTNTPLRVSPREPETKRAPPDNERSRQIEEGRRRMKKEEG